jgi:hypothetical protein
MGYTSKHAQENLLKHGSRKDKPNVVKTTTKTPNSIYKVKSVGNEVVKSSLRRVDDDNNFFTRKEKNGNLKKSSSDITDSQGNRHKKSTKVNTRLGSSARKNIVERSIDFIDGKKYKSKTKTKFK